ncbi:MAG: sugar transferase [bacterium]|nr:sugar transferase [bacterium]
MLKRGFDILFSIAGLVILTPLFIVIAVIIKSDSKGPVFFKQQRVGKNGEDFTLIKFRSMAKGKINNSLLTIGSKDSRITGAGYYLRKYKLDEFPQLINVLKGEMSFVGPRPEVRKYVAMYDDQQMQILEVQPGITDVASIKYRNENELLAGAKDPEEFYIRKIMPEKIKMNLEYINDRSVLKDVKIIFKTFAAILS